MPYMKLFEVSLGLDERNSTSLSPLLHHPFYGDEPTPVRNVRSVGPPRQALPAEAIE
jgi:hypothetical protein